MLERVLIVGYESIGNGSVPSELTLRELQQLVETAGGEVIAEVRQKRHSIAPATYVGKGKVIEIAEMVQKLDIHCVIFDDELTPSQALNCEKLLGIKVLDRTQLILDIFAMHAKSRTGQLQVQIAQLRHLLPRLRGRGTEMSRLGGGIGTRGPGETKLETDRRKIRKLISVLERELDCIKRSRTEQRKRRLVSGVPLVALAGYTNVGKSTLHDKLSGSNVKSSDELFTTLDPTTRRVSFGNKREMLITDTVGFITKLPTRLVEAFHSTLEVITDAHCVLHVVDVSSPHVLFQARTGLMILEELGVEHSRIVTVLNKVDLVHHIDWPFLRSELREPMVSISAFTGYNLDKLKDCVSEFFARRYTKCTLNIPYMHLGVLDSLYRNNIVLSEQYADQGVQIEALLESPQLERLRRDGEVQVLV